MRVHASVSGNPSGIRVNADSGCPASWHTLATPTASAYPASVAALIAASIAVARSFSARHSCSCNLGASSRCSVSQASCFCSWRTISRCRSCCWTKNSPTAAFSSGVVLASGAMCCNSLLHEPLQRLSVDPPYPANLAGGDDALLCPPIDSIHVSIETSRSLSDGEGGPVLVGCRRLADLIIPIIIPQPSPCISTRTA